MRTSMCVTTLLLLTVATPLRGSACATLSGTNVELSGLFEPGNLSGVCRVGEFLVVGTDEGELKDGVDTRKVQVLRRDDKRYVVAHDIPLRSQGTTEIDVEGLACDGRTVYVIGSHSAARSRVDDDRKDKPYDKNLARLEEVKVEPSRDALYRLTLNADGTGPAPSAVVRTSLRTAIDAERTLAKALGVPSKENGVDIEGIAVKGQNLFVAFRGPVLREGWVPIVTVAAPTEATGPQTAIAARQFVNLGGLGIRDIASVSDGFLLLAGPVGDGPPDFRLYLWDGKDMVVGAGSPGGTVRLLGNFPAGSGRPEGVAVLREDAERYELLVVFDDRKVKDDAPAAAMQLIVPKSGGS